MYRPRSKPAKDMLAALGRGPMSSIELAQAARVPLKSILGLLRAAIAHGEVVVDRSVRPMVLRRIVHPERAVSDQTVREIRREVAQLSVIAQDVSERLERVLEQMQRQA
jgi:hypothetical protein